MEMNGSDRQTEDHQIIVMEFSFFFFLLFMESIEFFNIIKFMETIFVN